MSLIRTKKTFSGTGLKSFVLEDLQPVTDYSTKVHCGSSEHFYKWGEWSKMTHFRTKEDSEYSIHLLFLTL